MRSTGKKPRNGCRSLCRFILQSICTNHIFRNAIAIISATPILSSRGSARRPFHPTQHSHAPEPKPLPPGYICHRCSKKGHNSISRSSANSSKLRHYLGHWIQDCPTNDDRDYDNRPRIKRTTGIPRSFLKPVEAPQEGAPHGIMVTPEGGFVIAQPDV